MLEAMCASMRTDGTSEATAAVLAGWDLEGLRAWKQQHPEGARRLAEAGAGFRRARRAAIRNTCLRDGSLDWRAQAWLLEHPDADADEDKEAVAVEDPSKMKFNVLITPAHLEELQRRRRGALQILEAKRLEAK